MNTKDIILNYKEVAEYLDDNAVRSLLSSFEARLDKREYLLPFIGQFSAGKSRLINHLLGRDLLPTKSVETTAFLTYISYGEKEEAVISYLDGTSENIGIGEVSKMDQDATKGARPIAALYISLKSDILKSGLIIVDTPGVNTLITEHVRMTSELLEASQYIVYVLGSSPSEVDIAMLQQIESLSIPVFFVRNKADLIHKTEESVGECVRKEKETLVNKLGRSVEYFAVTNETGLPGQDVWDEFFNSFVAYLNNNIVANISAVYDASIKRRLALVAQKFTDELNRRESLYRISNNKSVEQLQSQQVEIRSALNSLNRILERNNQSFGQKSEALQLKVTAGVKDVASSEEDSFAATVGQIGKVKDYLDRVKVAYQTQLPQSYHKMGQVANDNIAQLAKEATDEVKADIASIAESLTPSEIDLSCEFDLSVVEQIAEEQSAAEEQIREQMAQIDRLKSLDENQLAELGLKKQEVDEAIAQYDALIKKGNDALYAERSSHQVQFKTQESELAKTLSQIGGIVDVATTIIPGKGWTYIAGKAGKLGQVLGNASKYGRAGQLAKAFLERVQKDAQAKADEFAKQEEKEKSGEQSADSKQPAAPAPAASDGKKQTNMFDYLNLSHWMGKLGEVIDPPTTVVDVEAEQQFENMCRTYQLELDKKVSERMEEYQKMGAIKDEIHRKQKEQELRDQQKERLDRRLKELKEDFEEKKAAKEYSAIREQIVRKFHASLEEYSAQLIAKTKTEVEQLRVKILSAANSFVQSQLEDINRQLDAIVAQRKENKLSAEAYYNEIATMKQKLASV